MNEWRDVQIGLAFGSAFIDRDGRLPEWKLADLNEVSQCAAGWTELRVAVEVTRLIGRLKSVKESTDSGSSFDFVDALNVSGGVEFLAGAFVAHETDGSKDCTFAPGAVV